MQSHRPFRLHEKKTIAVAGQRLQRAVAKVGKVERVENPVEEPHLNTGVGDTVAFLVDRPPAKRQFRVEQFRGMPPRDRVTPVVLRPFEQTLEALHVLDRVDFPRRRDASH